MKNRRQATRMQRAFAVLALVVIVSMLLSTLIPIVATPGP